MYCSIKTEPKADARSENRAAKLSSMFEWIRIGTLCVDARLILAMLDSAVFTSSVQPGSSNVKYCPRFPTEVKPAWSAAAVFSTAAGKPITKSSKCSATGVALVSYIKSVSDIYIKPVSFGWTFRNVFGYPIDQSKQIPYLSTWKPVCLTIS